MELKHGEPRKQHWRRSRHLSIPAQKVSFGFDGLRPSTTENSGNEPSNNQQKMKSSKDPWDGLDTPSESQWPVSHIKPWPGSHREREGSEATQETPGAVIWRLKQRGWVTLGDNLRGWPRIGMPGELLKAACAPARAKGNDNDAHKV